MWAFLKDFYRRFTEHECLLMAAAISYYGLFSLFPLLLVSVSVVGYVLPASPVHAQVESLIELYVPGSAEYLIDNLGDLVDVRRQVGLIGVVALIWVSSAVFSAITRSMSRIHDVDGNGSIWRDRLVGILMVFFLGFLVVLSLGVSTAYEVLRAYEAHMLEAWGTVPLSGVVPWALLGQVVPLVLTFVVFSIMYAFFPTRRLRLRDVWPGAVFSMVAFEVAKNAFVMYLRSAAHFKIIHGSLTAVIFLLLWIYITVIIILAGAQLNAQIVDLRRERQ